jgi:hypothetical protein
VVLGHRRASERLLRCSANTVEFVTGPELCDSAALAAELAALRTENQRLLRLTRREAAPPGPAQAGFFEASPGLVSMASPLDVEVAFFGALFAARTDIYAVRWEQARTGQKGWLPAVRGGWHKGVRHADRDYLPLRC